MTFPSYYLEIIKRLYEADGWVEPYSFYETTRLSPIQVAEAIADLLSREVIEADANMAHVRMTPAGYRWTDTRAFDLFMEPRAAMQWRSVRPKTNHDDAEYSPSPKNLEIDFLTALGRQAT